MSFFFLAVMSENRTIHISMMKNWVSHLLFLRKRGLIISLAALKRGVIWSHIHTMSNIGSQCPTLRLAQRSFCDYFDLRYVL